MQSYNKTTQCDLAINKFFANDPEAIRELLVLSEVSEDQLHKIRIMDYVEEDGKSVFLVHPSHRWVKDVEVSHTRGMVFEWDGNSLTMIGRSIPPPIKSTLEEIKSAISSNLKCVLFPLEEGVAIRVIWSNLLKRMFVSSHRTLECRPHRWEDSTERFGEAVEKVVPGFLGKLDEEYHSENPPTEVCRTYLLATPGVCDTNQNNTFRQIHRWVKENNTLVRDNLFSTVASGENIAELMKVYNGVIVYDPETLLCLSLLRPEYERVMELRGDLGSILVKYCALHGEGNREGMDEMKRVFPKYASRFESYEKKSARFVRELYHAFHVRYVEKKFWKLPGVGHFIVKKANDTGLTIDQILSEYSADEYLKLLKSYFNIKSI